MKTLSVNCRFQHSFHFLATRSSCTSLAESYRCCNHGARCTGMPCARGPSVVCTQLVVVPSFGGANAVGSGTAADLPLHSGNSCWALFCVS